ncbi:aminotransferase class V-fold PLP-dependent enzyme [Streptomyces sp. NBC_01275]|uniref:DegT/DnrJ/EryC1/StrS family aminotransferase n=1 Tax=Streptomyces sp. NBC_01275 TaxID=2903807 RepID=UPI00225AB754|nr:aminotransferase class V-fold PLP-dependent enzyme [Streptomyces sp. NBC_01275]MCX4763628.1 aminotransferase class V-fold PLP-dependent enzyme [Streptomyces sp. NBC_01275]
MTVSKTSGIGEDTIEEVARYLGRGGPLSIGDGSGIIERLERRLEDLLGIRNVLTCSSGTAALHSAYLALDLPTGAEVVAPVTTFHASVTPALQCGLTPVLVDVDPDNGNMSPSALREAITERTRCVVVTHNLGHPVELDEIADICREHGLRLIEDCSHAYLSTYRGRPVGTVGDIAVWSMQAAKTLVAGEGGFLATEDRALFERACLAGHYRGRSEKQIADPALRAFADTGMGLKYRLHPLAAVIAWSEAAHLVERVERRQRLLTRLSSRLEKTPGVRPPVVHDDVTMGGWFSYRPTLVPRGDDPRAAFERSVDALQKAGVPAHRPSIGSLDSMPLFTGPPPLRHATSTWRPRLCGPFDGARAYEQDRLSVTVTAADDLDRMEAYADAFADVMNGWSGSAAVGAR